MFYFVDNNYFQLPIISLNTYIDLSGVVEANMKVKTQKGRKNYTRYTHCDDVEIPEQYSPNVESGFM